MNPTQSTSLRRDEESRSTRNEDEQIIMRLRNEEEKLRRRREWERQQELERQHEKLKKKMIEKYEKKRAEEIKSKRPSSHHNRRKSSSKSPSYHRHRERSPPIAPKPENLFKTLGSTSGVVPLFKGPKGTHISSTELRRIKVDIHRNIPVQGPVTELQRDIVNPEEVILKRRDGEGCKPIFEREEIKYIVTEVEERRTVVAIDSEQSGKLRVSKRRSSSLSPVRSRSYNPEYPSSHHTKYRTDESQHQIRRVEYIDYHKNDRQNDTEKYKDKYTDRDIRRHDNRSYSRERDSHSSHSKYRDKSNERSRERRDRERDRDRDRIRERDRDRDRNRDRDRDRDDDRDRERSRDRRATAPHYIEHVPVPIYYGNFPPRPIIVNPMVTIPRGQVPPIGRGRHPPLMAPVRSFPPRFGPPELYRMGHPTPNPRYGPIF